MKCKYCDKKAIPNLRLLMVINKSTKYINMYLCVDCIKLKIYHPNSSAYLSLSSIFSKNRSYVIYGLPHYYIDRLARLHTYEDFMRSFNTDIEEIIGRIIREREKKSDKDLIMINRESSSRIYWRHINNRSVILPVEFISLNWFIDPEVYNSKITNLIFDNVKGNYVLAGGSITSMMANKQPKDYDIFFYQSNDDDIWRVIDNMYEKFNKYYDIRCYRTLYAVTLVLDDLHIIQFIFKYYENKASILYDFDLGSCQYLYNGSNIYGTYEGLIALKYRFNIIDKRLHNHINPNRVNKYIDKGFGLCILKGDRFIYNLHDIRDKYGIETIIYKGIHHTAINMINYLDREAILMYNIKKMHKYIDRLNPHLDVGKFMFIVDSLKDPLKIKCRNTSHTEEKEIAMINNLKIMIQPSIDNFKDLSLSEYNCPS